MRPITREIIDRRQPTIRWGAVFAGAVVSIGVWVLLQTLGTGIGLATVETDSTGSLRSAGIGTGIWSLIAPLIAMFIGGLFAGRLAGTFHRGIGAMHGVVMWALTSVLGILLLASIVMAIIGGVARAGGEVVSQAGSAASGIDSSQLIAPINQRLQQQGKPPITPDQLDRTVRAVAQRSAGQGRLDREMIVEELARNTSLSRSDAEDVANQLEQQYQEHAPEVQQQAKHVGLVAADKAGKALLFGGIGLLVSLIASAGGAALGARRRRDDDLAAYPSSSSETAVNRS